MKIIKHDSAADQTLWPHKIDIPYLLVLNLPLIRHAGRYWADPLWAKDLLLHTRYIENLSLFCPIRDAEAPEDWIAIENVNVISAGRPGHIFYAKIPLLALRLWRPIGQAGIVHVGLGGWPFPMGWLAIPIVKLRRRLLLTIIESSFWRVPGTASITKRAKAAIFEILNRVSVNSCHLALFTTTEYRTSLATAPQGDTYVTPATWIDESQILSPTAVRAKWRDKTPRFLFAGRLTEQKGVTDLLKAIKATRCQVDIVGVGDLIEECRSTVAACSDRARFLPMVPYGDAFSAFLDDYAAIIVPTRSDEQTRIVFDAFARGIPVIASATAANTESLEQSEGGIIFRCGDASDLAAKMEGASNDLAMLEKLGLHGREFASTRTHSAMHQHRAKLIFNLVEAQARRPVSLNSGSGVLQLHDQLMPV